MKKFFTVIFLSLTFVLAGWYGAKDVMYICAGCYGLTVIGASWYLYRWKKATGGECGHDPELYAGGTALVLSLVGFLAVWALDKRTDCNPDFYQVMLYPTLGLFCAIFIIAGFRVLYFPISDWKNNRILTKHGWMCFTCQVCLALFLIFLGIGLEGLWVFSFPVAANAVLLGIGITAFIAAIVVMVLDFAARFDEF